MRIDFLANIQGLILDMDGVLWRDQAPLLDIPAFFAQSAEIGLSVILATNNSTKTVDQYIEKLAHFGAQVRPEQIVNSSMAAADYLKRLHPQGGPVFIVGESGLRRFVVSRGLLPGRRKRPGGSGWAGPSDHLFQAQQGLPIDPRWRAVHWHQPGPYISNPHWLDSRLRFGPCLHRSSFWSLPHNHGKARTVYV